MGSFFANLSLLTEKPIAEVVSAAMSGLGYRPSTDGEPLYLLPNNGKWQTLHLEIGNPVAEPLHDALAERCEAMLAICCVDSDFMTLELTRNGMTETVCIGEPYDPMDIESEPTPGHWQPIVGDLDAFRRILGKDYVLAEESLAELGPLFGFDAAQINVLPDELAADPPTDMIALHYDKENPSDLEQMRSTLLKSIPQIDLEGKALPAELSDTLNRLKGIFFSDQND